MPKGLYAKIIIKVEAEDDEINDHFEKVENEFVVLADAIDDLISGLNLPLLTLSIEEE